MGEGDTEVGSVNPEQLTGEIRDLAGPELLDVNATGDKLGMLTHPNKETANQLREFIPEALEQLMSLDDKLYAAFKSATSQTPEGTSEGKAALERFQALITAFARIAYHPEGASEGDLSDSQIDQTSPIGKKPYGQIELEDDWHTKTYGHKYTLETAILEYPQKGLHPKYIAPSAYDFDHPAIARVKLNDGRDNLFIDIFPTRHAPYPPKYSYADGLKADEARAVLTEHRVNPEIIKSLVDEAEKRAVEPHIAIRLEGPLGKPIAQARGEFAVRDNNGRQEFGFNLKMRDVGMEDLAAPKSPVVNQMEQQSVFLPLPSMKRDENTPLAPLTQAMQGLQLKKVYEVRPGVAIPQGRPPV